MPFIVNTRYLPVLTVIQNTFQETQISSRKLSFATGSAVFAIYFMIAAMTIASPFIGNAFSLSEMEIGLLIQAHLFAMVLFLIPAGRLGDHFGHHTVFLAGCFIFTLCSLGCGLSPSAATLIGGRFLQGIGDAMIMISSYVLLTRSNRARTGSSIGKFLGAAYFGYFSGTLLSGLLTDFGTWRSIFRAVIPFTFIAFVVISRTFPIPIERTSRWSHEMDTIGFVLFAFGTLALFSGVNQITQPIGPPAIAAGGALLLPYIIHEKRTSYPQIPLLIFRDNRFFSFSILADLTYYLCMGSTTFLINSILPLCRNFPLRSLVVSCLRCHLCRDYFHQSQVMSLTNTNLAKSLHSVWPLFFSPRSVCSSCQPTQRYLSSFSRF